MGRIQFILGPTGSGKTEYIERRIIEEAVNNPATDYLFLVPEQSSLAIQSKLASIHPNGGYFNIEVFGFNRLMYKVFEELNVRTEGVLDDFGKSMLIRKVAGDIQDKLVYYKNSIDKPGFIDQVKSLMSELYQYDIKKDKLRETIEELKKDGENHVLVDKLTDLKLIFDEFDKYMENHEMIVAEQTMELLYQKISQSQWIKNCVVILDGFTGFTPIQIKVIEKILENARKTYAVITIDEANYNRNSVKMHELFSLSKNTIDMLRKAAETTQTYIEDDLWPKDFGVNIRKRWTAPEEFEHLERNIFRYPYKKYIKENKAISVSSFANGSEEMKNVAMAIRDLVKNEGYRYKDIAVISGNLEATAELVDRVFPEYNIAYFKDCTVPIKANAIIDGISYLLAMLQQDMSYETVFAFLKSGIIPESVLVSEDIERLENYVLKYGIRGRKIWESKWSADIDFVRETVMEFIGDFMDMATGGKHKVVEYIKGLSEFITQEELDIEERLGNRLFESLMLICQKLEDITKDEMIDSHEFRQLFELGVKELNLGMVPSGIDMVAVGDITRTRLADIKVLFIVGVNAGVVPKVNDRKQVISDADKEKLKTYGMALAPSDACNDYYEQFYLYLNMSKPSSKLFVSYVLAGDANGTEATPSYVISRLLNIYDKLEIKQGYYTEKQCISYKAGKSRLIELLDKKDKSDAEREENVALMQIYSEAGEDEFLEVIEKARVYSNVPNNLKKEVVKEIEDRLLNLSVSQLESYSKCEYAYYLKYMLGLHEREEKTVNAIDFGNIIHDALKNIYNSLSEKKADYLINFKWGDKNSISYAEKKDFKSDFDRMIYEAVDAAYEKNYMGFENDDRIENMKNSIIRVTAKAIEKLFENYDGDGFIPTDFEMPYTRQIELDDSDNKVTITGKIDRVDMKDDKVRVIDYKSGNTEFKLSEVYEGLQLQLAIYLNAIMEIKNKMAKGDETKLTSEGAYYYHITDKWITEKSVDSAAKKKKGEYELDGFGMAEYTEDEMETVLKYADYKIKKISEAIMNGNIDKNPYKETEEKKQCAYCPFKANCRFDVKSGGNKLRNKKYSMAKKNKDSIIQDMKDSNAGKEKDSTNQDIRDEVKE